MIEKKNCASCSFEVVIINCHYQCDNCGFAENCHDMPHMIDMENDRNGQVES